MLGRQFQMFELGISGDIVVHLAGSYPTGMDFAPLHQLRPPKEMLRAFRDVAWKVVWVMFAFSFCLGVAGVLIASAPVLAFAAALILAVVAFTMGLIDPLDDSIRGFRPLAVLVVWLRVLPSCILLSAQLCGDTPPPRFSLAA